MQLRLNDISNKEFELINDSVFRLLEEFGILFECEQAQEMFIRAGNKKGKNGRVHLNRKFVEARLAEVPKDGFKMFGRDQSKEVHVNVGNMMLRPATGTPFILDYKTQTRREVTMDDARDIVTLCDALDGYEIVNSVVSPPDSLGAKGNIKRFVNAHRYSLKPSDLTVMNRHEVKAVGEIASAIRGSRQQLKDKPLTAIDVAMITPLRCAGEQVEALMECAEWGMPIEVLTSPAMAMTSPITLAGSVTVAMAEVIAALCLVYLKQPGLGIITTARISPTNMRTASYNYGAPELGMGSVLMAAVSNRYRIPGNYYGFGTSAPIPGTQCQLERTQSAMLIALAQPHVITGGGTLDNSMVTSPEQMVIDNEAFRFMKRICKSIEITEESIGLESYMEHMLQSGEVMTSDHTLKYLREGELIDAGLGQWVSYVDWRKANKPTLYDRANKKVQQILSEHKVEPFERGLQREIDRIVDGMDN